MATPSEIRAVAGTLTELPKQFQNCKGIALAYVQTGQRWWNDYPVTDYQRSRDRVMGTVKGVRRRINQLRRDTLSAHLVRTEFYLGNLLACCKRCPDSNRHAGKEFGCLVGRECGSAAEFLSKFQLDEGGQVLERE